MCATHVKSSRLGARILGVLLLQLFLSGNARGTAAEQIGVDDLTGC